jgi:uncharacterized membrane protein YphA (DoxX/SURF4 family)
MVSPVRSKIGNVATLVLPLIETTAGILLAIGLWTPVVSALATIIEVWTIFSRTGDLWIAAILATLAASLAMIGPGAWSIDARLFGRKHMDIPER